MKFAPATCEPRRLDGDGENHKISTAEQHQPETIESQMLEATTRNQRKNHRAQHPKFKTGSNISAL